MPAMSIAAGKSHHALAKNTNEGSLINLKPADKDVGWI
jgi:hypothetical protein